MITDKQKHLLQHMLGATENVKKKNWGYRNYFCAEPFTDDFDELVKLQHLGFVWHVNTLIHGDIFYATRKGAIEIGFKKYQLKCTDYVTRLQGYY